MPAGPRHSGDGHDNGGRSHAGGAWQEKQLLNQGFHDFVQS